MVDFKFQLNRQGVRGQRGEKGDTGFSPVISEKTNTDTEYVLHIQNETDETSFDTPNLKEGLIPEDLGGTVVRYNRETGKQYYGEIDNATEEVAGVVKLEPELTTLNPRSETSVLTAQAAADHYASLTGDNSFTGENGFVKGISVNSIIGNDPDGLTIVQNNESKISLTNYAVSIGRNTLPLILNGTTVTKNGNEVLSVADVDGTTIKIQDGKLHAIGGGGGSGDVTAAGDNTFTGNNVFNGQVVFESGVCNANKAEYLTEEDVDNQTIQVVDGKLHANLDELGNEVNDLSGRVTATEADILTLKTSVSMKQTKLTAGNNITLTDLSDGTVCIDSTGGGGTPDNMVTTDTEQTITGLKYFQPASEATNGVKAGLAVGNLRIGTDAYISPNPVLSGDSIRIVDSTGRGIARFYNSETIELGGDTSTLDLICSAYTVNLKARGSLNWIGNLTIGGNSLKYTSARGETTDLLAGGTPTVIDGGDSTTT